MRGLSPVAASGGLSSSRCAGLSLSRPLLLWSTGSRRAGSVIVAHGPSCSAACGILPDQGSNPCPLRWQADSQPLRHQGSPVHNFLRLASFMEHNAHEYVFKLPRGHVENNNQVAFVFLGVREGGRSSMKMAMDGENQKQEWGTQRRAPGKAGWGMNLVCKGRSYQAVFYKCEV